MSAPAVSLSGLTKQYFGAEALAPLDLVVHAGERVSLIGHNGSGKTTLIKMLAGVLEPSSGSAAIVDHEIGSIEARAALSYVADDPVFYDDLTVWEHLEYVARLHHTDEWEQHAAHLVEVFGLSERVDHLPATFSRGLKQKTQLALAFVRPFDVLVVDEPFVGLDRAGRAALLELLDWAHDDGAAVIVATHELGSVGDTQRVIALSDGSVVFDGDGASADFDRLTAAPMIAPESDEPPIDPPGDHSDKPAAESTE